MKKQLVYNVVYERNGKIEKHNIFQHAGFVEELQNINKTYQKAYGEFLKDKNIVGDGFINDIVLNTFIENYKKTTFTKELTSALRYYFWARAEYEIVLTDWPTMITKEEAERIVDEFKKRDHYREAVNLPVEVKVDVYDQVTLNFDLFVDYVWENLSEL